MIYAPKLADKLFPYIGLPTNFLVNARGTRTNLYPFGGNDESLTRLIKDLSEAAK